MDVKRGTDTVVDLPERPRTSESSRTRFDVFATRILYVVVFGVAAVSSTQADLWWLLRAGKDIWRTHRVALVDHYSYTAYGDYWSNHEWLWEAIAYALHAVGGMPLLAAWTAATITGTVIVLRRVSSAEGYVVPIVIAAALPLMSIGWTIRPQVTSLFLFALVTLLLAKRREAWLPLVFLVWANLHAQVVMGGVALAATWALAVVLSLRSRTSDAGARVRRLSIVLVLCGVATLATPLGPRLWTYVLSANARPGQNKIAEWQTVFHPYIANGLFFVLVITLVVLAIRRPERLTTWRAQVQVAVVVAMTPLAMLATRNIPFFVAAAIPLWMTLMEFRTRRPIGVVPHARRVVVAALVITAVLVGLVWRAAPPRLGWHPIASGMATALRACPGNLYNDYNIGAFLIWWVPDVKVFVDNRQDPYSDDVMEAAMDATPKTFPRIVERWDVRCAIVGEGTSLSRALKHEGWQRTYVHDRAEIWVKSS